MSEDEVVVTVECGAELVWSTHLGSFGPSLAWPVLTWVGLGGSSKGLGGRPSQRSRGPEADVAMTREAAMVLRRIVLWPEPEAWWDP